MKKTFYLFLMTILGFVIFSCNKENENKNASGFANGIFISCEGGYNSLNGSVSYFNPDSLTVIPDLFYSVNGIPLGDIVQSVSCFNGKTYIVVNNSQKVEVVESETFKSVGTIHGVSYPRYFLGINQSTGLLTNGKYEGVVYFINLNTLTITDSISVGKGPDHLIKAGDFVYVANSGGYDVDSTISIIDISAKKVIKNLDVDGIPTDLTVDGDQNVWVINKGFPVYDTDWNVVDESVSKLIKISPNDNVIASIFEIGKTGGSNNPLKIAAGKDGMTLYYSKPEGIYTLNVKSESISKNPIINKNFYGLDIDPEDGKIYGFTTNGFSASGYMFRYTSEGQPIDSFKVGIAPNGAVFN